MTPVHLGGMCGPTRFLPGVVTKLALRQARLVLRAADSTPDMIDAACDALAGGDWQDQWEARHCRAARTRMETPQ